jgi:DNA-binding LacI/PurR family transcriptional regulator
MTGLSVPTVVQVLGSRGHRYRQETRDRVLEAATQIGYRPNAAAKALHQGRFGSAAILCGANPWLNLLPQLLVDGIMDELDDRNMHLTLARLSNDRLNNEDELPKVLTQWMADGLLINYNTEIPQQMQQYVRQYHLPAIWLNSKHAYDCVHPDDYGGSMQMTQRLLEMGHRKIAYADYNRGIIDPTLHQMHYSTIDRAQGYRDAMIQAGLPTQEFRDMQQVTEKKRLDYSIQWLTRPDRPTAVIANGMAIGMSLWQAALILDIRVPEELSVVAFGHGSYGENHMGLNTWIVPEYLEGREAVKLLCLKIQQPDLALKPVAVPFDCVRDGITLGPAPA